MDSLAWARGHDEKPRTARNFFFFCSFFCFFVFLFVFINSVFFFFMHVKRVAREPKRFSETIHGFGDVIDTCTENYSDGGPVAVAESG